MQDVYDFSKVGSLRTGIPVILVPAVILFFFIAPVTAHAPTNISIAYNPDMHKLSVTVTHPVDDPATHYVRGVQVKINGYVISDPLYKSQPSRNTFTYTYDVMANPGDAVWVVATCINGQSLEEHIEIPQPTTIATRVQTTPITAMASTPPPTVVPEAPKTTYAAVGLLPLLGAAAVLAMRR
jgi:hypothetical protein